MPKPTVQRANFSNNPHPHPDHFRYKAVVVAVAACFTANIALANPTAPTVVHGTASFNQAGSILNVTNSHNAIINWGSFSIGVNELTKFIQPSALSAVLNRVVGQDPSAILGALQSNGRVFLINPNGIVFGAGAQINVAGLVASTLNLSNDDFLNNRMRFTDGAGAGSVVNQGSITGGNVYLVGNAVTNNGLITSPNGQVVLAAGNSVELVNPGTPNLRVEIVAPDNEARNLGTITADAGRIGIYAGLIKQGGIINADSAVAEGGRIVLKSTKSTTLEAGSVISARGTSGGQIEVLSDMATGTTKVEGSLDVSAQGSGTGVGGFIETSAANVQIGESTRVYAMGKNGGAPGMWLIDPENFSINPGAGGMTTSSIGADTLATNLASTPVTIATNMATGSDNGDVRVLSPLTWTSNNSLTLTAFNNVEVNSSITNTGTAAINLYSGWDGISSPMTPTLTGPGGMTLDAPISTGGIVSLVAGGSIYQTSPITAAELKAVGLGLAGGAGVVDLGFAMNSVGKIAGSAKIAFAFKNSGNLTIGSVGGVDGITVDNSALNNGQNATIAITVLGGSLTVAGPVKALAAGASSEGGPGGNAAINLTSDSTLTVNRSIEARGGNGGSSGGSYAYGGYASIHLQSISDNVNVNNSVTAVGGNGIGGGRGGDADVSVDGLGVTIAGAVVARGGHALGTGSGNYAEGGEGSLSIYSAGSAGITVTAAGSIAAYGGNGGNDSSYAGHGGSGNIYLNSSGPVQIAGPLLAVGGMGGKSFGSGYGSSYYGSGGSGGGGGDASVYVSAGYGGLSITNTGSISATARKGGNDEGEFGYGGHGGYASIYLANNSYSFADFLTIEGPVTATSGAGGSGTSYNGNAGSANVSMSAYGGGININNTMVLAIAPGGPDGSEGGVSLYAPQGTINTATSTVSAQGVTYDGGGYYYNASRVSFSAYGGITLGLVESDGVVQLTSSTGAIIDGNAGLNISAPLALLYGYGGVGTIANPLETQVAGLDVSAYGGEIGIINSGNLSLLGLSINNGNAAVGTTGSLNVDGGEGFFVDNGNLALFANGNMDLSGQVYVSGDLLLNAGGNLTIGGGSYYTTDIWGYNSLNAVAGGDLNLLAASYGGRSWLGSDGVTTIKTGGNVLVDQSTLYGYPDVVMNVGGVININGTAGYGGSIEAGSPLTIHLTFPMLQSGGYSVNGIAGLVYDPATGTGFFADGSPAVLGQNLLVTYGGAPVLTIPTNTLIVAMNESIKPPDPGEKKDAFEEEKDRKKKETQSCR